MKKKSKIWCQKKSKLNYLSYPDGVVYVDAPHFRRSKRFLTTFFGTDFFLAPNFFLADLWTGPAPRAGPVEKKVSRKKFRPPNPRNLGPPLQPYARFWSRNVRKFLILLSEARKKTRVRLDPPFNLTRVRLDPPLQPYADFEDSKYSKSLYIREFLYKSAF